MYAAIVLALAAAGSFLLGRYSMTKQEPAAKVADKVYRSGTLRFALRYPGNWRPLSKEELAKLQGVFAFGIVRSRPGALFSVRVQRAKTKKNVPLDALARALDKTMPKEFSGFKKRTSVRTVVGGKRALRYEYTFVSAQGTRMQEQLTVIPVGGRIYHLVAWSTDINFDKARPDFVKITRSLDIN